MPCSQNEADDNRQLATTPNEADNIPEVSIVNPLLAYMLFALQSGTAENVRQAVIAHFPLNAVLDAKTALWDACDNVILGDKLKRKDSQTRTELEAHVQDILIAINNILIDMHSHSFFNSTQFKDILNFVCCANI